MRRIFPLAWIGLLLVTFGCSPRETSESKIINGRPVESSSPAYSSAVRLDLGGGLCTGSVIAPRLILTAAHCLEHVKPESITVTFEKLPKFHPSRSSKVLRATMFKEFGAQRFPNFDVAFLELERDVPAPYAPIEILRDPAALSADTPILLAGVGNQSDHCTSEACVGKLLETNTRFKAYHDKAHLLSLLVFHGTAREGLGGACNGDSGGPAYAQIGGQWYLVGVTNGLRGDIVPESDGSCASGWDIYTFAGDYASWLETASGQSLKQDVSHNPNPRMPSQLVSGPLQSIRPTDWADWVAYANHEDPSWYTVDTLLQNMISTLAMAAGQMPAQSTQMLYDSDLTETIASNLDEVYLNSPSVGDLSPLQSFRNLRRVYLDKTSVRDLSPLSQVLGLKYLRIDGVPHEARFDFFNSLGAARVQLESLVLEDIAAEQVHAIDWSAFPKVANLSLARVGGTLDLGLLRPSTRLPLHVSVSGAEVKGRFSAGLSPIVSLALSSLHTPEGEQAPEANRPDLQQIVDWSSFPALQALTLNGFDQETIPSLTGFSRLRSVDLGGNRLRSLATIAWPSFLESLDVSGNALLRLDLPPDRVGILRSYDNPLEDSSCPAASCLRDLHLSPKTFEDYCENALAAEGQGYAHSYRTTMQLLQWQTMGASRLDCEAMRPLVGGMRYVMLNESGLRDIRPLAFLGGVQYLMLDGNAVEDVAPMLALSRLEYASLAGNQIRALPSLAKLGQLTDLNLLNNPLRKLIVDAPQLRRLSIGLEDNPRAMKAFSLNLDAASELEFLDLGGIRLDEESVVSLRSVQTLRSLNVFDGQVTSSEEFSEMVNLQLVSPALDLSKGCSIINGSCVRGPLDINARGVLGPMLGTLSGERIEAKEATLHLPGLPNSVGTN